MDLVGFKQMGWLGLKVNELDIESGLGPNRLG